MQYTKIYCLPLDGNSWRVSTTLRPHADSLLSQSPFTFPYADPALQAKQQVLHLRSRIFNGGNPDVLEHYCGMA